MLGTEASCVYLEPKEMTVQSKRSCGPNYEEPFSFCLLYYVVIVELALEKTLRVDICYFERNLHHKFIGRNTIRTHGFVTIGVALLEEVWHYGGGF